MTQRPPKTKLYWGRPPGSPPARNPKRPPPPSSPPTEPPPIPAQPRPVTPQRAPPLSILAGPPLSTRRRSRQNRARGRGVFPAPPAHCQAPSLLVNQLVDSRRRKSTRRMQDQWRPPKEQYDSHDSPYIFKSNVTPDPFLKSASCFFLLT